MTGKAHALPSALLEALYNLVKAFRNVKSVMRVVSNAQVLQITAQNVIEIIYFLSLHA